MRVLVLGGTGFVGRHLLAALAARGDDVVVSSRDPARARRWLGGKHEAVGVTADALAKGASGATAVVNLSGANLFAKRWSPAFKREIRDSRVTGTQRVVEAIGGLPESLRPRVLVNASAVGYYGSTGEVEIAEGAGRGRDFLAEVCDAWEQAAVGAEKHGVRVVRPRIGVVLGEGGGALDAMLPAFRAFVGGPVGSGRQWMSWVHVQDVVSLLVRCMDDASLSGPLNVTAPEPVRMSRFAKALGAALGRPSFFKVPGFAVRLAKGDVADVLEASTRVIPRKALDAGFEFAFSDVESACKDLVG